MKIWNNLSNNEKAMIGAFLLLIIMVVLSWGRISEGFKKGVEPFNNKQEIHKNNE